MLAEFENPDCILSCLLVKEFEILYAPMWLLVEKKHMSILM